MSDTNSVNEESKAFDERMEQRILNGHIPDLRRTRPTPWFYNNVWRHPYFVDKVIGQYYRFLKANLPFSGARVLEVGSGPGHMTLELARDGFHVTGIDLSPYSVEVARKFASENSYTDGFGSLEYFCTDFMSLDTDTGLSLGLFKMVLDGSKTVNLNCHDPL